MLTVKPDMTKLNNSLAKYAKMVGETGEDAVARMGVQLCRELIRQTQCWGTSSKSMDKQVSAMYGDAGKVVSIVSKLGPKTKRGLRSERELNDWIEVNRTKRRGRTAELSASAKKIVEHSVFQPAMRKRVLRAGMAKGAWIGAGDDIAKKQNGLDRVKIGKAFDL